MSTREYCNRCQDISLIGFSSLLWKEVAGPRWENSTLCIRCFGVLGDERGIAWEEGLELFPLSLVNHLTAKEHAPGDGHSGCGPDTC